MPFPAAKQGGVKMEWTKAQTNLLNAILDQLIPSNPEKYIPGAGELGVSDFLAECAAKNESFRDSVDTLLRRANELAGEVTPAFVRQLETELPAAFTALLTETYKGYYSRPDMRAKVGVGAHPVHPEGYDVARETPQLMDELTASVRMRGPIFRDQTGERS